MPKLANVRQRISGNAPVVPLDAARVGSAPALGTSRVSRLAKWVARGRRRKRPKRVRMVQLAPPTDILVAPQLDEYLTRARFVPPKTIELLFADDRPFRLGVDKLGMPLDRIRWETVRASPTGGSMTVTGVKGETVPIDATTLRYLVDRGYAAKVDAEVKSLRLTRDELKELAEQGEPPQEWFNQSAQDLTSDSWK